MTAPQRSIARGLSKGALALALIGFLLWKVDLAVLGLLWGAQAVAWSLVGAVVLLVRRRTTREVASAPVR